MITFSKNPCFNSEEDILEISVACPKELPTIEDTIYAFETFLIACGYNIEPGDITVKEEKEKS